MLIRLLANLAVERRLENRYSVLVNKPDKHAVNLLSPSLSSAGSGGEGRGEEALWFMAPMRVQSWRWKLPMNLPASEGRVTRGPL